MENPMTYNDALIAEKARRVYMLAMNKAEAMLTDPNGFNPEKLDALANIADAAATSMNPEDSVDPF